MIPGVYFGSPKYFVYSFPHFWHFYHFRKRDNVLLLEGYSAILSLATNSYFLNNVKKTHDLVYGQPSSHSLK